MSEVLRVVFIQKNGIQRVVECSVGMSILEVAHSNDVDLDGNCGGALACSTCHVIVGDEWIERLQPAVPEEEDLLDIVFGVTPNSRLGCQIFMSPELDGIVIKIPA